MFKIQWKMSIVRLFDVDLFAEVKRIKWLRQTNDNMHFRIPC